MLVWNWDEKYLFTLRLSNQIFGMVRKVQTGRFVDFCEDGYRDTINMVAYEAQNGIKVRDQIQDSMNESLHSCFIPNNPNTSLHSDPVHIHPHPLFHRSGHHHTDRFPQK